MMLRTKIKIRNFLRDALLTILFGILLITAFGIVGHYDYEYYCLNHPTQCQEVK